VLLPCLAASLLVRIAACGNLSTAGRLVNWTSAQQGRLSLNDAFCGPECHMRAYLARMLIARTLRGLFPNRLLKACVKEAISE
jgi:hypothetical protein